MIGIAGDGRRDRVVLDLDDVESRLALEPVVEDERGRAQDLGGDLLARQELASNVQVVEAGADPAPPPTRGTP